MDVSGTPTWVRGPTFVDPAAAPGGFRGLVAFVTGSDVTILATTTETAANRAIKFVDTGAATASAGVLVSTAGANTVYRGIALAPHR